MNRRSFLHGSLAGALMAVGVRAVSTEAAPVAKPRLNYATNERYYIAVPDDLSYVRLVSKIDGAELHIDNAPNRSATTTLYHLYDGALRLKVFPDVYKPGFSLHLRGDDDVLVVCGREKLRLVGPSIGYSGYRGAEDLACLVEGMERHLISQGVKPWVRG